MGYLSPINSPLTAFIVTPLKTKPYYGKPQESNVTTQSYTPFKKQCAIQNWKKTQFCSGREAMHNKKREMSHMCSIEIFRNRSIL